MNCRQITFTLTTVIYLFFNALNLEAQVTIGSDFIPANGSLLDLKQSNEAGENSKKGLLLPRVLLEDKYKLEPTAETNTTNKDVHAGLTLYHIGSVELCEGVYTWNGEYWVKLGQPCASNLDPELIYSPNCYIVPSTGSQIIPVAKAYLVWGKRSDLKPLSLQDKVSASLIWQDTKGLITSVGLENGADKNEYSKLEVKTSNQVGNALVAVHIGPAGDSSDPIRWSWHIWVTPYSPNVPTANGTVYTYNNGEADYTFMDRNLGALSTSADNISSMGLLYEWGRKDPFTSGDSFGESGDFRKLYDINNNTLTEMDELTPGYNAANHNGIKHIQTPDNTKSMLSESILKPMTYYYGSLSSPDWYSSISNTGDPTLWGVNNSKSYFDPCPAGWKVPSLSKPKGLSPWAKFETDMDELEAHADFSTSGNGVFMKYLSYDLGFYPLTAMRTPYPTTTGPVGGEIKSPGGVFPSTTVNGGSGPYWITNTPSVADTAKLMFFERQVEDMLGLKDAGRALGAAVRCVKE